MPSIDVEKYLRPVSEKSPCGEDLEYDSAFVELERIATAAPESREGVRVEGAGLKEPAWGDVFESAGELLGRSRDLRLVVYLVNAGIKLNGFADLAAGLRLAHGLLRDHWNEVYPRLDPDDGDSTLRVNTLAQFEARPIPGAEKQPPSLLKNLEEVHLVRSRVAGSYSRRDLKLAKREIVPRDRSEAVPELALIEAAFHDADLADLQATADSVAHCIAGVKELRSYLRDKLGADRAPEFALLQKELDAIDRTLKEQLRLRGVAAGPTGEQLSETGAGPAASGEIRSRDDVIRTLDRVSDYFRKHEPSSPVPLLLQRAKRLVAKDFLTILRDLTPGGVAQAEVIIGSEDRK